MKNDSFGDLMGRVLAKCDEYFDSIIDDGNPVPPNFRSEFKKIVKGAKSMDDIKQPYKDVVIGIITTYKLK